VTLFEEVYQQHRELIAKDAIVVVEGMLRFDEFSDAWRLAARRITDLHQVREQQARRLVLRWPRQSDAGALIARLADILAPWRKGSCAVTVQYCAHGASCALNLAPEWNVRASRELLEKLEGLVGREGLKLLYGAPAAASHGPAVGAGVR
jgi:DNA polymerase III subunit alpha